MLAPCCEEMDIILEGYVNLFTSTQCLSPSYSLHAKEAVRNPRGCGSVCWGGGAAWV